MVEWDSSILVGIPTVDDDHKDILKHINQFIAVIEARSGISSIHDTFRNMEARIYRHLGDEEQMLTAVGYVETEGHISKHDKLTDELGEI